MSAANWVDAELRNWSRWCNAGGTILPWGISAIVLFDEDEAPIPIHEDHAKKVQSVFDASAEIERKVLQAEYLSPSRYNRNSGAEAAARFLQISKDSYEIILSSLFRRVERVFT